MSARLVIGPQAEQDLQSAIEWYNGQKPGLGIDFLDEVRVCINGIREHPEFHSPIHKKFRRALVKRFPYAIYYKIVKQTVEILAIVHYSRRPSVWRRRLR